MKITPDIMGWAQVLWDYHHMHHELAPADCILTLGSHDSRVALRAAELYYEGMAPLLIFSGGLGRLTAGMWKESEASIFAKIAIDAGVPEKAIVMEERSTNTGENILFTQQLLLEKDIHPTSIIVVQKPYMERRSYATFKKLWPGKSLTVTSPQIPFEQYSNEDIPLEKVIHSMVGDLQRIHIYPYKGFQIHQDIPDHVWQAYESLVAAGFDKQLVR
jgi:uncharacterized SAM-binding protein YcdF (DUF218 family)